MSEKTYRIQIAPNAVGTFSRPDPSPETIRILKDILRMAAEKESRGMVACPRCNPPIDPMCPYCNGTGEIPMRP